MFKNLLTTVLGEANPISAYANTIKLALTIAGIVVLVSAMAFGVMYVKGLQKSVKTLTEENAVLKGKVQEFEGEQKRTKDSDKVDVDVVAQDCHNQAVVVENHEKVMDQMDKDVAAVHETYRKKAPARLLVKAPPTASGVTPIPTEVPLTEAQAVDRVQIQALWNLHCKSVGKAIEDQCAAEKAQQVALPTPPKVDPLLVHGLKGRIITSETILQNRKAADAAFEATLHYLQETDLV